MSTPDPRAIETAKLVIATIDELPNGISKDSISQHLANEYSLPNEDICKYLNKAINKGIAFGAIKKLRGRYHPGEVMEGIREHRRRRRRSRHGGRRRRRRRRRH